MKRCPKCNCGAQFTNKVENYAGKTVSATIGVVAGVIVGLFHPSSGGHTAHTTYENLTKNMTKHYKCTNPVCLYEWDE